MARDRAPRTPQRTRTFDEVFGGHTITPAERAALVWHLAAFRARKTVETLLPETSAEAVMGFNPHDILRAGRAALDGGAK